MTAKFKTANIFVGAGITKTAKFNARQYFCVYGTLMYSKLFVRCHMIWFIFILIDREVLTLIHKEEGGVQIESLQVEHASKACVYICICKAMPSA